MYGDEWIHAHELIVIVTSAIVLCDFLFALAFEFAGS